MVEGQRVDKQWSKHHKAEVIQIENLIREGRTQRVDIAELFGISTTTVTNIAKRAGLGYKGVPATAVDTDEAIEAEIQRATEALQALRQKQAERSVRCEWDGRDVLVYGVTQHPIRANYSEWLRWLKHEGPRILREHISQKY